MAKFYIKPDQAILRSVSVGRHHGLLRKLHEEYVNPIILIFGGTYLEKIQSGYVVKTGPGYVIPDTDYSEDWHDSRNEPAYVPLQVKKGDYAIFMRRESIEIEYEGKKYLIVPQSGVLAIVREKLLPPEL